MNEVYKEPLLDDDYPIYVGYWYVINGVPQRSEMTGTCLKLKQFLERQVPGQYEIRRCDAVKRNLPVQW